MKLSLSSRTKRLTILVVLTLVCANFSVCVCNKPPKPEQKTRSQDEQLKSKVENLIRHINDNPSMAHGEQTHASDELIRLGLPALRYGVLELYLSDDPETRMRAWIVVNWVTQVVMGHHGAEWDLEEERKWQQLWRANGPDDWLAPQEDFRVAYKKWHEWLDNIGK